MDKERILITYAFNQKVLAVAAVNCNVKDWAAYIDAVPGTNHDYEKYEVARVGNKLPYEIAKLIFPRIASDYKWRD